LLIVNKNVMIHSSSSTWLVYAKYITIALFTVSGLSMFSLNARVLMFIMFVKQKRASIFIHGYKSFDRAKASLTNSIELVFVTISLASGRP